MYKKGRINDAAIGRVKEKSEDEIHLIAMIYLHLFNVSLKTVAGFIDPKDYRLSNRLAEDLIDYACKAFQCDRNIYLTQWLFFAPSARKHLGYYEVEYKDRKEVSK